MTTHFTSVRPAAIALTLAVAGLAPSAAIGQPPEATRIAVPLVPSNLDVPAGHSVSYRGFAVGTQNFVCLPSGTGAAWRFLAPQATLFRTVKGGLRQQLTTHFLSANPDENGLLRPTWHHSIDTSRVWGRVLASSADPNFVASGAIPWLLLEASGTEAGPTGGRILAHTTFIHRLNTSGGIAPGSGCTHTGDVGAVAHVPYTAEYFFYRADSTN
jgi:hypothetical protein